MSDPEARGPRSLSDEETGSRIAILEHQKRARAEGERMTDDECAAALGITRSAWVGWKRYRDGRKRGSKRVKPRVQRPAGSHSSGSHLSGQASSQPASELKRDMFAAFERGEQAVQTLARIRALLACELEH